MWKGTTGMVPIPLLFMCRVRNYVFVISSFYTIVCFIVDNLCFQIKEKRVTTDNTTRFNAVDRMNSDEQGIV